MLKVHILPTPKVIIVNPHNEWEGGIPKKRELTKNCIPYIHALCSLTQSMIQSLHYPFIHKFRSKMFLMMMSPIQ